MGSLLSELTVSLALRTMIDHPPCSILNLQRLAMASCRPGRAFDTPPRAAARLMGGRTLARSPRAAMGSIGLRVVVLRLRAGCQHKADDVAGKAASSQEAHLACALTRVARRGAELALP